MQLRLYALGKIRTSVDLYEKRQLTTSEENVLVLLYQIPSPSPTDKSKNKNKKEIIHIYVNKRTVTLWWKRVKVTLWSFFWQVFLISFLFNHLVLLVFSWPPLCVCVCDLFPFYHRYANIMLQRCDRYENSRFHPSCSFILLLFSVIRFVLVSFEWVSHRHYCIIDHSFCLFVSLFYFLLLLLSY